MTYRLVKFSIGLVMQDPSTKALIPPTAAQVYLTDHTTVATIASDEAGTALTNTPSVPTGVTPDTAGIDTTGNLTFWADPTLGYSVLVNSVFLPVPTLPINPSDFTDHVDGTDADPHGDRAYADGIVGPLTTDVSNAQNDIAAIQGWTAGNIPVDTTNGAQGPNIQAAIDALVASGVNDVLLD